MPWELLKSGRVSRGFCLKFAPQLFLSSDSPLPSLLFGGMQSQLICSGCRSVLRYPREAASVFCDTLNSVPSPGAEMAHVVCGVFRTLLMYTHGATRVRCFRCYTVNPARTANHVAHVNCGQCHTTLIYLYGAPSVKCALCHYITNVGLNNMSAPIPVHRPNGLAPAPQPNSAVCITENCFITWNPSPPVILVT